MRRAAAILCVFLTTVVVASATAAVAAGPIMEPSAADKRRARSVVIRASDLGTGWKGSPSTSSPDDRLDCPGYHPDLSDLVQTANEFGPDLSFEDGLHTYEVYSSADSYRTPEMLDAAWARETHRNLLACYKRTFAASVREGAVRDGLEAPRITWVKASFFQPEAAAPKRLGLELMARFPIVVDGARVIVNFRVRHIGLGSGRGEAGVAIFSYFAKAPDSLEASLVKKLDARLARAFPPA